MWWNIINVVSFLLPHVKGILDIIIARYNPEEDESFFRTNVEFILEYDHLIRIYTGLLGSENDFVKRLVALRGTGNFSEMIETLKSCECYLASVINQDILVPMVLDSFSQTRHHAYYGSAYNLMGSVEVVFPIAYKRYREQEFDLIHQISKADINPLIKMELMNFIYLLNLLDPNRVLSGPYYVASGQSSGSIFDKKLLDESESAKIEKLDKYLLLEPRLSKDWAGMAVAIPKSHRYEFATILNFYGISKDRPTVADFLESQPRFTWLESDPNFSFEAVVNAILRGRLAEFRQTLALIEEFVSENIRPGAKLPDMTDPVKVKELLAASRHWCGSGLVDYVDRLKSYVSAYVFIKCTSRKNASGFRNNQVGSMHRAIAQNSLFGVQYSEQNGDRYVDHTSYSEVGGYSRSESELHESPCPIRHSIPERERGTSVQLYQ